MSVERPESLPPLLEKRHEKRVDEAADHFLGLEAGKRLEELGFEALTDEQRQHAESLGITQEDYARRLGVVRELSLENFRPSKHPTLRESFLRKKRGEQEINERVLEKIAEGDLPEMSEEERAELLQALKRAIAVNESIQRLSHNPAAEQEIYILMRKRSVGTVDDRQMIEELHGISERYDFIPPAPASEPRKKDAQENAVVEKAEEREVEKAQRTLGVEASSVLGKNRQGELLIRASDVLCGFDPGTFQLHWIKININGHEYKLKSRQEAVDQGSFEREIGSARMQALFEEYDLPFDSPGQERLIEIWGNQTGDIQEFRYEDFSGPVATRFREFLEALKPTASQGVENATQSWKALGILNDDNTLNRGRYETIVQAWVTWTRGNDRRPFLDTLESKEHSSV